MWHKTIDERTTRHDGYAVSQQKRKRVEEVFGWMKTVALQRKTRFKGLEKVGWMFTFAAAEPLVGADKASIRRRKNRQRSNF